MLDYYYKQLTEKEKINIIERLSEALCSEESKIKMVLEKMNPIINYKDNKVITYKMTYERIKKELVKLG